MINMRLKLTIGLLIILFVLVIGCTSQNITGEVVSNTNEKISVRLPIPFTDGAFAPFYTAIDKGYLHKRVWK